MLLRHVNKYPGTDYETFNWEWILKTVKTYMQKVDDFIEDITDTWNDFKDGTTGEIDQMHDDFANYVNVTEGALNTGAIANGAITSPKIDPDFLLEIENTYVTPEMYGAVGDGTTDDTMSLREAVRHSHVNNIPLKLTPGKIYLVSDSLNYYEDAYYDPYLNMTGCNPARYADYNILKYGGIRLADGTSLFKNATVRGSISNINISSINRSGNSNYFENCMLSAFVFINNGISQLECFMLDSGSSGSVIENNKFLTVYQFEKYSSTARGFTDSTLKNNYINGGEEKYDNSCFNFTSYNGSIITDNFIDYYRIIYEPKSGSNFGMDGYGVVSNNNQYQAFRYFYHFDSANHLTGAGVINSTGDIFNWMTPSTNTHLQNYVPLTYMNSSGVSVAKPPYIFDWRAESDTIMITDAVIQSNISKNEMAFIETNFGLYSTGKAVFTTNKNTGQTGYNTHEPTSSSNPTKKFYNDGTNAAKGIPVIDMVESVDTLPTFNMGWSDVFAGQKIKYNNNIYTATIKYENGAWTAAWRDEYGNVAA